MSTTHVMHYESGDTQNVLWRCEVCRLPLGFNRQGFGNPWASETYIPEDLVDPYLGPCAGEYVGTATEISREVFLKRLASSELGAMLGSTDTTIRGFIQKVVVSATVDIADPETRSSLLHAVSLGYLDEPRIDIILRQ